MCVFNKINNGNGIQNVFLILKKNKCAVKQYAMIRRQQPHQPHVYRVCAILSCT